MLKNWLFGAALLVSSTSSFAANQAEELPTNDEMTTIFTADQKARQGTNIDWNLVRQQDAVRQRRTQALLDAGALKSGDDFLHAAFVFQHGGTLEAYLKAHLLAIIAIARGNEEATWIAAATLDRYLQASGKPQILGTQFRDGPDGRMTQEPFDPSIASDELRRALSVPTIVEQEARRQSFEAAGRSSPLNVRAATSRKAATSDSSKMGAGLRTADCTPIPGADEILLRPHLRWIVVGEIHGTTETPSVFADLVCLASRTQPVTVALEQSISEQSAIDAFISSDGGATATARFLSTGIWTQPLKDGRSSEAMFDLFRRLRVMHAAGRVGRVVAFQPKYAGSGALDPAASEKALAASLTSVSPQHGPVLVLVGNAHAMRKSPEWANPPYLPMASYLPLDKTLLLDARWSGGSYWACTSLSTCGPQVAGSSGQMVARSISTDSPGGAYSGALNIGVEVTASPPQGRSTSTSLPIKGH